MNHDNSNRSLLAHGCSDLYNVILLTVNEIAETNKQESEIEAVKWHDIDEILASGDIYQHNKNFILRGIEYR